MFRTQHHIVAALAVAALLTATTASANDSPEAIKYRIGTGNPVTGKAKSELCQGCHGEEGISSEAMVPKLAGQYSLYISKQLRNFQTGERKHEIMSAMAATIDDADLADIAAYFASKKQMKGNGAGDNAIAKNLFANGDMSRNILPCKSCHGEDGKGTPDTSTYPVIGGQQKAYLRAQLVNWRSGNRANSPDGVMNKIAKSLSDAEIDALTDYISGR